MRDLEALLTSLVNIDRNSLIAVLSSEADSARRLAGTARQRTSLQRDRHREAVEHAARIELILQYFLNGEMSPDMSERDVALCRSLQERLRDR
jgi:hypothetical protein